MKEYKSFNNILKSQINKIQIDLNKIKKRKIIHSCENMRNMRNNSSSKERAISPKERLNKIIIEKYLIIL